MKLSKSKIKTFKSCPYLFKLSYIDKVKMPSDPMAFVKGKEIHSLLEGIYDAKTDDIKKVIEHIEQIPKFALYYDIVDRVLVFNAKANNGKLLTPLLTEKIMYDEELDFSGVVDVVHGVDNDVLVLDYKSGRAHYARGKVHKNFLFELTMYAYLVEKETGKKVTHIGIWFVEWDNSPIIQEVTREMIEEAKIYVTEVREEIKVSEFPKKWNIYCNERCIAFLNNHCSGCRKK